MLRSLLFLPLLLLTCAAARAALTNFARTGTATASSEGYGAIAADGNDGNLNGTFGAGSVFHTLNETGPSWWQVAFSGARYLDHVRIFNRVDTIQGSVGNFRVIAKLGATEVFNQVFLPSNATDNNNCRAWGTSALRGVQADTVRIERVSNSNPSAANFLTFAECEVWGSTTALTPLLSPVSVTASPPGFSTAIGDASDGDIHGNYSAPSSPTYHSATQGGGQFWEADYGTKVLVKSVLLFNRSEVNGTQNVRLKLLDNAGAPTWTQDVSIALGTATPFYFGFEREPNVGGRKLRVETIGNEFLMLAEVQAFGTVLTLLPPVVENVTPAAITGSTAQTGVNLTSTGFAATAVKLYWGPADGGTNAAAWANVVDLGTQSAAAVYSHQLIGLTQTTPYYLRAFAQNSAGSDWVDATVSFTTPTAAPATLVLQPAFGIAGYTALLNGTVTNTGFDPPQVTLYWGTTDGGTTPAAWAFNAALGTQSGAFGRLLTNLAPNTAYYISARAVNGGGPAWTPTLSFTTTAKSAVVINEVHYEPVDNTRNIEFIELWNPSDTPQDISGWRLDGPVQFQFSLGTTMAANSYRTIAACSTAFQSWFGTAPNHQWAVGQLKNSGDRIQLRDAAFTVVDDVDYAPGFPWPTSAAGAGPSIELISPGLENDVGGSWRNSTASPRPQTPGATNTALGVLAPPGISNVAQNPQTPAVAQDVIVTAKIEDGNGVASAALTYVALNPGVYVQKTDASYNTGWTSLPMNDSGSGGDALAGDRTWSVTIPASVQAHRRLVRYRIAATDALGGNVTAPYPDDEQPNFAYFCYNGLPAWSGAMQPGAAGARGTVQTFTPAVLNTIPPYHLIANETDVTNSQYNSGSDGVRFLGTMVYDGIVYDHIQFKNRGIGSTYVSGKNKWAFYFNRGRNIRAKDNWGRYYDQTWNSMSMDACASPWCAVHRGMAGIEEIIGYRIYELCGVPALRTHYVHWRVIDSAAESGPTQYDGDLWGLYTGMEPYESNFLDERDLPDGNIISVEGYGADQKHQSATQPAGPNDWGSFASGTTQGGQTEAWYRANMDVPAFCTFQALNRYVANVDIRGGDNYRAYHRPAAPLSDNRWVIMPYDQDMMLLPGHHWGATVDGVGWAGISNQWLAVTRHPTIAAEFRNRCRELMDLLGSDASPGGGQFAQLVDEYAQMVNPSGLPLTWADADAHMWNLHPRTAGGGGASGYTSHRNNFFKTPYADFRGANLPQTNWTRTLPDPDGNGYGDFEGLMAFLSDFGTNTWPGATWARSNGNPKGYGFKYLEWESLYGGLGVSSTVPDVSFPNRPTITYTGTPGYPANRLDFQSSAFSPAASGSTGFSAVQWRIGEIYAPGISGYIAGQRRRYEIEDVWTSSTFTLFNANIRVPLSAARPGNTYRARVRHKDANGRWSRWSEAVQFTIGVPDVSAYQSALVISEVNYNPAPTTQAERDLGYLDSDLFEWIEIKNISATPVDMTGLRFTKGADFDFPPTWTIPASGFALVVKNLNGFRQRWGTAHNGIIAGTFTDGNLSNGGEEIKLSYGAGTAVRAFAYDDNAPWPETADGTGSTMVLKSPNAFPDHTLGGNWRASTAPGGSPGTDDLYTYALWAAQFPGIGDTNANPDGDELNNRLEYAFAGNPTTPGVVPINGSVRSGHVTITFNRRNDTSDLTFTPEFSIDLTSWTAATVRVSSTPNPDGTITETWRSSAPVSLFGRMFVRLFVFGS